MTTLKSARRKMLEIERSLGRLLTPSAFAAQTVTVPQLAVGSASSGRFAGHWLLRPDAATALAADRVRLVTPTGYAAATGILTHAGTAYVDQTVGAELVELLSVDPANLDNYLQRALGALRYLDQQQCQSRPDGRYDLTAYPWLTATSHIGRIGRRLLPTLTPNRRFDRWGTVHTDGTLRPDGFTNAGAGATFARSTTTFRGPYSYSVTRSGADTIVSVTFPVRYTMGTDDSLRLQHIQGVLVSRAAAASNSRVRVESLDATGTVLSTTNSSYHTGGGAWEELRADHTVHASAEAVKLSARGEVDGAVLLGELYAALGATIDDSQRRDNAEVEWQRHPYAFEQTPLTYLSNVLALKGAQIVVESERPYPLFDATRFAAGTADSDPTDCPEDLLAFKALALYYADRADESQAIARLAAQYATTAEQLQQQHLYVPEQPTAGVQLMGAQPFGRRFS